VRTKTKQKTASGIVSGESIAKELGIMGDVKKRNPTEKKKVNKGERYAKDVEKENMKRRPV